MKIKEYNQMMAYLTRREPTIKESEGAFKEYIKDGMAPTKEYLERTKKYNKPKEKPQYLYNPVSNDLDNVNAPAPKRDILDYINQQQHIYEGTPLSEKNKKIVAAAKGGVIKDPTYTTYSNGGTAKNQKKIAIPKKKTPLATEKNNIVIAMSETPEEEFQLQLGAEIEQFMKWLKENKNGTYKEFLEDKTAFLTEEQKKDPKIIDLEPYLPKFEDEIKKMEEQEEKKETMEDFIKRRSNEMMLAEARNSGVSTLLKLNKRI